MSDTSLDALRDAATDAPCDDCPSTECGEFGDYGATPSREARAHCVSYQDYLVTAIEAHIAALEAELAKYRAPVSDEALREAVERLERGCERRGTQCVDWHAFPYNVCLGCVDDTFHRHQYRAGNEQGTSRATITTALKQYEQERADVDALLAETFHAGFSAGVKEVCHE